MLTGALLELLPDPDGFLEKLNQILGPGIVTRRERAVKCGITGTHIRVQADGAEEDEEMHSGHAGEDGQEHSHSYEYGQGHSQEHGEEYGSEQGHSHEHGAEYGRSHEHGEEHGSEQGHSHGHGQEYGHSHEHGHEHGAEYGHSYGHGQEHSSESGHQHTHEHSSLAQIEHILDGLALPGKVREDARAVYRILAEAEASVHGTEMSQIHFHEVGTKDAIADIVAVCLLFYELAPQRVVASPVHVGSGYVKCAHGMLPVPAPATARILQGIPMYGGSVQGELCTPTGAALLAYFADQFGEMPLMRTEAVGYGMGKKDFPRANCVRAMLGESGETADVVLELSCNVDDMTAEEVGFAMEQLFAAGAKEVYTVPVGMKKSRPGTLIRVLCGEQDRERMLSLLFGHTTTLGVRESRMQRYVLTRETKTLDTPYGQVRRKLSSGFSVSRSKFEYEDLARIAREQGSSLEQVRRQLDELFPADQEGKRL